MSESKAMILGVSGPVLTQDERALIGDERPWGFILFARNCVEASQIADLAAALRDSAGNRHAPILIDQEGGRVQRIREPLARRYPPAAALGALYQHHRETGLRAAWLMSRLHAFDLARLGINVDCLPVLDVPVAGASNVIGDRAYGFDPVTVAAMGAAAAAGLKAGGVLPVLKHIPGHGRGMADSHHELPVVRASREALEAHDFPPFIALRHELMAMSAHIVYTALDDQAPATISPVVIEEVIRGHIGFDGLLMSDDVSMNALKGDIGTRAAAILAAGCDIVLHCNGVFAEMRAVADAAQPLSGAALRRARSVEAAFGEAAFGEGDGGDEAALRAEFDGLLAVA